MHRQIFQTFSPENKSGDPYGDRETRSVSMTFLNNLGKFSPPVNRLPRRAKKIEWKQRSEPVVLVFFFSRSLLTSSIRLFFAFFIRQLGASGQRSCIRIEKSTLPLHPASSWVVPRKTKEKQLRAAFCSF